MNLVFFTILLLLFNPVFLCGMHHAPGELNGLSKSTQQLLQNLSGQRLLPLLQDFEPEDVDAGVRGLVSDKHEAYRVFFEHLNRRQPRNEENNDQESPALGQDALKERLEQEFVIALFCKMSVAERGSWRRRDDSSCAGWCMTATGAVCFIAGICVTVYYATLPC